MVNENRVPNEFKRHKSEGNNFQTDDAQDKGKRTKSSRKNAEKWRKHLPEVIVT